MEKHEINIEINPELFYPGQTILGFALVSLQSKLLPCELGQDIAGGEGTIDREINILDRDATLRRQGVIEGLASSGLSNDDFARDARRIEERLAVLPERLGRLVSGIHSNTGKGVAVSLMGQPEEVPLQELDLRLMRNAGILINENEAR